MYIYIYISMYIYIYIYNMCKDMQIYALESFKPGLRSYRSRSTSSGASHDPQYLGVGFRVEIPTEAIMAILSVEALP